MSKVTLLCLVRPQLVLIVGLCVVWYLHVWMWEGFPCGDLWIAGCRVGSDSCF